MSPSAGGAKSPARVRIRRSKAVHLEVEGEQIHIFFQQHNFVLPCVIPLAHFFITFLDSSTIIIMDVITPLNNLPNLKQGQNGEEVALEIYGIVLDV